MAGADVGGAETFFIDAIEALAETQCEQHVIEQHSSNYESNDYNCQCEKPVVSFFDVMVFWRFPTD